jgi:hypothetical protein
MLNSIPCSRTLSHSRHQKFPFGSLTIECPSPEAGQGGVGALAVLIVLALPPLIPIGREESERVARVRFKNSLLWR